MLFLSSLVLGLLLAATALATAINFPADQPTIQAGIDAAIDGDSVMVAPGWPQVKRFRRFEGACVDFVDLSPKWLHEPTWLGRQTARENCCPRESVLCGRRTT
jgi:hypothetical protein